MRKFLVLALGLALGVANTAYAGFEVPLTVSDGGPGDTDGTVNNTVVVRGTIDPISIASAFSLTIAGTVYWFDTDGNSTAYDLGETDADVPNLGLPGFSNADILFHVDPADVSSGGDADPFGAPTFAGANNANDPGDLPASTPLTIYRNVLHRATDAFTQTSLFMSNNLGTGFTLAMDFLTDGVSGDDIWNIDTPGTGASFPIPTQYAPETWDGTNDGPIHVTAFAIPNTVNPGSIFLDEQPINGNQPVAGDPVAVNATNTNIAVMNTGNATGGNEVGIVTALDFAAVTPSPGTFGALIDWIYDSNLP